MVVFWFDPRKRYIGFWLRYLTEGTGEELNGLARTEIQGCHWEGAAKGCYKHTREVAHCHGGKSTLGSTSLALQIPRTGVGCVSRSTDSISSQPMEKRFYMVY